MKKNLLVCMFFLILSAILIFSWFRTGMIFGGGDVGLQTYDPIRVLQRAIFVWWDSAAPGTTIPQGLTAVPFQSLLSIIQLIGFSHVFIQAFFFFIILFFMGFGMYFYLSRSLKLDFRFALLGGVFYLFNPYMMIQVWHRFIHSSFFLAAALPFLILFWSDWIKNRKIGSLFLFLLTNLIASYLYGTIAYIVTVWLILFLVTLAEVAFPWEGIQKASQFIARFLIGLMFWILTSLWWFMPVVTTTPALLSQQHSQGESLVTLINISRQAILPYSLQMINPFYLFFQEDFGKFYLNPWVRFLPWLIVGIILIGFINSLKRKEYVKWSFAFLIIMFLAKGASPPFGYSFILGFEHFFPIGVLRNPFEKIGILLPFTEAILFVLGIKIIFEYLQKKRSILYSYGLIGLALIIIFLFNWRMLTPDIFGKIGKPAYVKVPVSYKQADEWIKKDLQNKQNQGKILHLPLTRGEDINYKWEYGYSGIEPSDLFFTALPSISRGFNLNRLDDSLTALYYSFHKFTNDPDKILRILQDFNMHYIVLHKDVKWLGGDLFDPLKSEEILNNLYFLKKVQTFGDLVIYKISDEYFKSKIYLVSNFQIVYPSDRNSIWPYLLGNENAFITPFDENLDSFASSASNEIIFPNSSFVYPKKSFVLAVVNQLATDESTLGLLLSQFTKIRPILIQNGEIQSQELNSKLISQTETIVKILRSQVSSGGIPEQLLSDYQQSLDYTLSKNLKDSRLRLYLNESDMSLVFQVHLTILEALLDKTDAKSKTKLDKIREALNNWMIKNDLIPQFPLQLEGDQKIDRQKVFKFHIPKNAQYEIVMVDALGRENFPDNLEKLNLSINGNAREFRGELKEEFITFGNYDLQEGVGEFGYDVITSLNLAQPFDKLTKVGNVVLVDDAVKVEPVGQFGYIESLIPNAHGGDTFRVSFEILSQNASGFYFQLAQDIDSVNENGQKVNQLNEFIPITPGNWQSLQFSLNPLKFATREAAVRFVIAQSGQLPPPAILIRNLKVEKVLNSDIVLRNINDDIKDEDSGQVLNIEQKSPVQYVGKVEIKKPSFLIFSETYHPGWRIKLTDGKKSFYPQKHVMANLYGNGWYIEDTGSFDFILEFEPQKYVYFGVIIAALCYLGLLSLIVWRKFKK